MKGHGLSIPSPDQNPGGLMEKVPRGGVTEYRQHLAGGSATAIHTRRSIRIFLWRFKLFTYPFKF